MKKSLLFMLPLSLLLTGCNTTNNQKTLITYGSTFDESASKINYDDLKIKIINEESFVLVIYPGDNSTCGCWTQFSEVIDEYAKENTTIINKINYEELEAQTNKYGLTYYSDRPTLALFNKGKLKKEWQYVVQDINPLFKSTLQLEKALDEVTISPKLIYVNQDQLDQKISSDTFTICYVWASCPDCQYAFPNVIIPYYEKNINDEELYIFDLEIKGILLDEDGDKNSSNENYLKFKKDYKMSEEGDETFGYARGFVPTLHRYENGSLISAITYFNDAISINENNEYYVSRSFFSEDRLPHLNFLNDFTGTKVLEGMKISEDDLIFSADKTRFGWDKNKANIYHQPLLEKFLSFYQK